MARLTAPNGVPVSVADEKVDGLLRRGFKRSGGSAPTEKSPAKKAAAKKSPAKKAAAKKSPAKKAASSTTEKS